MEVAGAGIDKCVAEERLHHGQVNAGLQGGGSSPLRAARTDDGPGRLPHQPRPSSS